MKVLLMHPDRDFDLKQALPPHAADLTQDLALETLLAASAGEDTLIRDVARVALLTGLTSDAETIRYRQDVVRDCLRNPGVVRELYTIAVETIEARRKHWFGVFSSYPPAILHGAVDMMRMFSRMLKRLRAIADAQAGRFESKGMAALFATLQREFSDEYFARVETHLAELQFRGGVLISAELGKGNEGSNYVLRRPHDRNRGWVDRIFGKRAAAYTFRIADRDEAGARALAALRDRGINLVANAMAQSTDHILSYFEALRIELAFYVGCLNLADRLRELDMPVCLPGVEAAGTRRFACRGIYDVSLALSMQKSVVGNDVHADGAGLMIITGANQGGKSSFLRGVGLAQLMMHAGLFVGAASFTGEMCTGLFTHYRREEDATMKQGKFDEELSRMSGIVDAITPDSMLLLNESFGATNEREGSEVARQIVSALLEARVRVVFVTHMYELARHFFESRSDGAIFLRAERLADGTRTFRLVESEPLETSYGKDLYAQVFGADAAPAPAAALAGAAGA
jgi:DNA mismatch repair ATPase MutS